MRIESTALCWHPDPVPALIAIDTWVLCLHCLLCYSPCHMCTQTGPWLHWCCCCCYCYTLLACSCRLYIVVPQDVVTVAVALEMHAACVGRDQHLCCLLFPPRHQHVCAFIPSAVRKEMMKWRMQLTLMHPTGMRKHVLATNVDWTETIHFQVWHVSSPLKNLK